VPEFLYKKYKGKHLFFCNTVVFFAFGQSPTGVRSWA
jgi:YHS domain-containing protein